MVVNKPLGKTSEKPLLLVGAIFFWGVATIPTLDVENNKILNLYWWPPTSRWFCEAMDFQDSPLLQLPHVRRSSSNTYLPANDGWKCSCGRSYDFTCFIFTTALRHALCCLFCCEVTGSRNQLGRPLGNFIPKSSLSGRCQRVHQPSKRWSKHLSRLFWRDWGPSRNNRSCVTSIFLKRVINIDIRYVTWVTWYLLGTLFKNKLQWSSERSSFKRALGHSKYINLYKVFFWGWLLRLPSGVKRQHFPFEESIPSSPDSQVLDIQSFCQHLPKVELSYTVEAPLNCGSQVNLRNASVEKFNKCILDI